MAKTKAEIQRAYRQRTHGAADAKYAKENTTFIGIKLNNKTDADILQALEGKPKQTEIKRLLRIAISGESQNK